MLRKNTEQIAGWDFDHDGNLKLAERTNQAGDTEILRVDGDGFKQIYSCSVLESCGVADFDATNKQAYLITNKGDVDLTEVEMLDPSTGSTKKYESDPENRVDVEGIDYSRMWTTTSSSRVTRMIARGCTSRTRILRRSTSGWSRSCRARRLISARARRTRTSGL